ncbi:MAG: hypothetical protein ABW221_08135 [Vicinamibacteria bacterium]
MSLIFEALKKLDREKKTPERGFLVLGGAPAAGERRLRVPALLLLLIAAAGGGFLIARGTNPGRAEAPPPVPSTTGPVTVPRLMPPAPLPPEAVEAPAIAARPPAEAAPAAPVEREAPATAAPAPLAAATPAPPATPAFALQAVAEQDGQPVAIVNGQLVRVGDLVNGARVLRIEREEVELDQAGRRLLLTF